MFGCIAAGRPVQTDIIAVSPTQFTFVLLPTPTPINHLVVFLLPETTLPPDTAATVYIQLSPTKPFRLLGAIANEKPSAIFRIRGLDGTNLSNSTSDDADEMTDESAIIQGPTEPITLGISIEPLSNVQAALATLGPAADRISTPAPFGTSGALVKLNPNSMVGFTPQQTLVVARKIVKNALNYLSGFSMRVPGVQGEMVPLKSFQDWWSKFEKKMEYEPGYLDKEDV